MTQQRYMLQFPRKLSDCHPWDPESNLDDNFILISDESVCGDFATSLLLFKLIRQNVAIHIIAFNHDQSYFENFLRRNVSGGVLLQLIKTNLMFQGFDYSRLISSGELNLHIFSLNAGRDNQNSYFHDNDDRFRKFWDLISSIAFQNGHRTAIIIDDLDALDHSCIDPETALSFLRDILHRFLDSSVSL